MSEGKVPRRRAAKKKPTERAIMMTVLRVIDPETGESIKALVPSYALDRRALNDRGLRLGDQVLTDVFKDRNPRFWRKFHALSTFLAENVDDLSGMKSHDALKKVQLDARVYCELQDFVLEDGTVLRHWTTKSLNFDDTDETAAEEIWQQLCDYVAGQYFPDWDAEQVKLAASHWERQQ